MATRLTLILILAFFVLATVPVRAQEVALDVPDNISAPKADTRPAMNDTPRPVSSVAGRDSNLRHWSRFSQAASSPFVRVPAGTRLSGPQSSVSHYVRPQCIQPGSLQAAPAAKNVAVKHHLACNLPTDSAKTAVPAAQTHKVAKNQTMALGYGRNIGEVTYTPVSNTRWSGTIISCYGRYH